MRLHRGRRGKKTMKREKKKKKSLAWKGKEKRRRGNKKKGRRRRLWRKVVSRVPSFPFAFWCSGGKGNNKERPSGLGAPSAPQQEGQGMSCREKEGERGILARHVPRGCGILSKLALASFA